MNVLVMLQLCACALPVVVSHQGTTWDWSRTQTWALVNKNAPFTIYEANFSATHYDIVGVGGTFGGAPNSGEVMQAAGIADLKKYNKNVKTLIYRNTDVNINGQLAADKQFLAHPEWILRDASGEPAMNAPGQPFFDTSNADMQDWFVDSIMNAIVNVSNGNCDGVFADGSGYEIVGGHNISAEKNALVNAGHTEMLRKLYTKMKAYRSDMILLGNGAVLDGCYPPRFPGDHGPCSYNLEVLDGACAEHFGSFEAVNATTGNFNGEMMENWMEVLSNATAQDKSLIVKGWPGPFSMYCGPNNTNCQFTWKNESNTTLSNMQKKALGAAALDWTLGAYLLIAAPNTYLSYSWWYQLNTGFVPCPDQPDSCSCPDDFYPDLERPTGAPLGPRKPVPNAGSGHVWTREFEKVTVTIDLGDFNHVTLLWK